MNRQVLKSMKINFHEIRHVDKIAKFNSHKYKLSHCELEILEALQLLVEQLRRKPVFGFPTRSDTNRPVQLQKMDKSLKFWI